MFSDGVYKHIHTLRELSALFRWECGELGSEIDDEALLARTQAIVAAACGDEDRMDPYSVLGLIAALGSALTALQEIPANA